MTGYRVDSTRRITLPEAIPGEVYDVEMRAPGLYIVRRQAAEPEPKAELEDFTESAEG